MARPQIPSSLEGSLFANNIPPQVFHNLIQTVKKDHPSGTSTGASAGRHWDKVICSLMTSGRHSRKKISVPYETAVDWICDGLAPLGEEYVATAGADWKKAGWMCTQT